MFIFGGEFFFCCI